MPDRSFIMIREAIANCYKAFFLHLKNVSSSDNGELYSRQRSFNPEKQNPILKTLPIFQIWKSEL